MYDTVYGKFQCESCEYTYPDGKMGVQVIAREDTNNRDLYIGDPFKLDLEELHSGDYKMYSAPERDEDAVFVDFWNCGKCGHAFNWAKITVRNNTLVGAESIVLSEEALASVNFVTVEAMSFSWKIENGKVSKTRT